MWMVRNDTRQQRSVSSDDENDLTLSRMRMFFLRFIDLFGPDHTNAFSFEKAYFLIRFRLSATLKTHRFENAPFVVWIGENGGF